MINLVIFSKDRACQLDLLLSSMKKYFRQWREQSVSVLYTHSSEEYAAGYRRVQEVQPEIHFVSEPSFKNHPAGRTP